MFAVHCPGSPNKSQADKDSTLQHGFIPLRYIGHVIERSSELHRRNHHELSNVRKDRQYTTIQSLLDRKRSKSLYFSAASIISSLGADSAKITLGNSAGGHSAARAAARYIVQLHHREQKLQGNQSQQITFTRSQPFNFGPSQLIRTCS